MQCWDSNSQPLDDKSPRITTITGLPPKVLYCYSLKLFGPKARFHPVSRQLFREPIHVWDNTSSTLCQELLTSFSLSPFICVLIFLQSSHNLFLFLSIIHFLCLSLTSFLQTHFLTSTIHSFYFPLSLSFYYSLSLSLSHIFSSNALSYIDYPFFLLPSLSFFPQYNDT